MKFLAATALAIMATYTPLAEQNRINREMKNYPYRPGLYFHHPVIRNPRELPPRENGI